MHNNILILAQQRDQVPLPITFELVSMAREIQRLEKGSISFLVIEESGSPVSNIIARQTGLAVEAVCLEQGTPVTGEVLQLVLESLLSPRDFSTLIVPGTTLGQDVAPGLAAKLGAACITGVTGVGQKGDQILLRRLVYGGKLYEEIRIQGDRAILTAAPGVFAPPAFSPGRPGAITITPARPSAPQSRYLKKIPPADEAPGLAEARVIVAAGNGMGSQEALALIKTLADLFPQAAIAGSRPVCDRGWLPYNCQVGVTGATVAPELYMACGISGAFQHLAGMQTADFIVAINRDPHAAIFNVADICIIEDLHQFLPALIASIQGEEETDKKPA